MHIDFVFYDRAATGSPEKTLKYLMEAANALIDRRRKESVFTQMKKITNTTMPIDTAVYSPQHGDKPAGKGSDGKGKSKAEKKEEEKKPKSTTP